MHLVYIDDSKDGHKVCFSALLIPVDQWQAGLEHLHGTRRQMRESDGAYIRVEHHATDWLGGRGHIATQVIPKGARARLFKFVLSAIARMPGAQLINAAGTKANEDRLFERLLNRIHVNVTKAGSHALIISDEGKSYDAQLRRLRKHNIIRGRYLMSDGNFPLVNMPLKLIVEDPVYRDSSRSFFIQAADFCAFSLLRFRHPTPTTIVSGIDQAFRILEPICVKAAFYRDPLGIISDT